MAMANSVRWYDHVLLKDDSYILIKEIELEVEGKKKKGRWNRVEGSRRKKYG